jgi:hypothetical protein
MLINKEAKPQLALIGVLPSVGGGGVMMCTEMEE